MADWLEERARGSLQRAAEARRRAGGEGALLRRALDAPLPPRLELDGARFDLIAEYKRRSPSGGAPFPASDPAGRARQYAAAGAAAISVLTEPEAFGGTLADLTAAAGAVTVPVMRKDFLVDPIQVLESRAAGAAGILLVARILDPARLVAMLEAAAGTNLFVLLEAFDEADLDRIAGVAETPPGGVRLLAGVNSRDLATLSVDRGRLSRLFDRVPPELPAVAESGMEREDEIRAVARRGYRLALVGTALMRAPDAEALASAWVRAGREAGEAGCASG